MEKILQKFIDDDDQATPIYESASGGDCSFDSDCPLSLVCEDKDDETEKHLETYNYGDS